MALSSQRLIAGCILAAIVVIGCGEEPVEFVGVKRTDEPLTPEEWTAVVRIADSLPEPKFRELDAIGLRFPDWQQARTLPVNELSSEERRLLAESWSPERLAQRLKQIRGLSRLLGEEHLTADQLAGLLLAIGSAMQRATINDTVMLQKMKERSREHIAQLQKDERLFASLPTEERYRLLDEAIWLHREESAQRLADVPSENVELAREHADWLKKAMPATFLDHPLDDTIDPLESFGSPFTELPQSGSDARIEWSMSDALIGRD